MKDTSPEMQFAMAWLASTGVTFYVVRERQLDCGCKAQYGWWTEKCEAGLGLDPCSPAHTERFRVIQERWGDPETVARYGDLEALDSLAQQMEEE